MFNIARDYWKLSRVGNLLQDGASLGFVIVIVIFMEKMVTFSGFMYTTAFSETLLKIAIPIFAIQASIQTSGIIFFANANTPLLGRLKKEEMGLSEKWGNYRKIDQLYVYFAWAIFVELGFLLYSCIFAVVVGMIQSINMEGNLFIHIGNIFLFVGVMYSVLLCIRNINLLYGLLLRHE